MDMEDRNHRFSAAWRKISVLALLAGSLSLAAPGAMAANSITDRNIIDAVENEFDHDPAVWTEKLDVTTTDGIVTLTGVTDNILEKERAAKIAQTVKGVRAVVNKVKVRPDLGKTEEGLARDVLESLAADPATEAFEIAVDANDRGKIVLKGSVDSWQEKHLAEVVAKGTVGVTEVDNRLIVDLAERLDRPAQQIEAEIEQRLYWDVLVDSGGIDVSVSDRTVTLTGTVGSAVEKYRANSLSRVAGVADVDTSAMEVQDWVDEPRRRNPDYANKSDEAIAAAVMDALRYDPRVTPFNLDVVVAAGEATLRGTVSNPAAKRSAEQDARNTVGVHSVTNRIKVRPVDRYSAKDLARRVQAALMRDPYVDDYEISVVPDNRIVKLYGTVDSYFEKTQADYVAERVGGVSAVVNNLAVRQDNMPLVYDPYLGAYPAHLYDWYDYDPVPTYRSDRAIRDDIEDELWWSPYIDADQVKVNVLQGRATLAGRVDSRAEWRAASENAWEGGATWVVNNLVVTGAEEG